MEASAPKRRKTSPNTNVAAGGADALGSDDSVRRSTRRRRPSFASPTKSSLARSNPDILERRNAARSRPPSNAPAPAPAASEPGSQAGDASDSELLAAQLEADSETGRPDENAEESNGNAPPLRSMSTSQPKSPVRRAAGGLAVRPRRTPNKPSPRPLPPPPAEGEELIDPFRRRGLRRSPPPGVIPDVEPEEPELPPTPTQKGIVDPSSAHTSPMGIHNTPSKRPRRSRALAEKIKSSPLKQPPLRPPELAKDNTEAFPPIEIIGDPFRSGPKRRPKKRKSHPARNVQEFDPLGDKKALRDSLLADVARLEKDLEVASRENKRLFQLQQTPRGRTDSRGPENEDDILELLHKYALPPEKEASPSDPTQDWLEAALNPIAFLPFGKASPALPSPFPTQQEDEQVEKPNPISHHPVPMTAEEELPYLRMFTPLAYSSTVSLIPREGQEEPGPLRQRHVISVSSTPPGLFTARVEMTVNTKTLSISDLSVPRLDPASVGELGPFVEKIVEGENNSALTKNVSVITWAMSEWVRLAMRRARFWCSIERELGTREGIVKCAKVTRGGTRRKRVGRPAAVREEEGNEYGDSDGVKVPFSKTDLLPHLGQTSRDLELPNLDGGTERPTVRILWRIEFDWTGEGQSKLGLLLDAPARWHGQDELGSLTNIPDMFDKLVQDSKDPMESVRTVVALIVGEGRR